MRKLPLLLTLLAVALFPVQAFAAQVTNLSGFHRYGQTFLTWNVPSATTTGWTYRLYVSDAPISNSVDLDNATLIGSVKDSTWCNRRLTRVRGTVYGYSIDSLGTPLDSTRGLFVMTPATAGYRYYAVTAQAFNQPEDRVVTSGQNSLIMSIVEVPARPRMVYQRTLSLLYSVVMEIYTLWTSPTATQYFPAMGNKYGQAYDCGIRRGGTNPSQWHALGVGVHARNSNFTTSGSPMGMPGEWTLAIDDFARNPYATNTWWYGFHENFDPEGTTSFIPTSGYVGDYTKQRIRFTIEWALESFPVDRTRVYAYGGSMGGIGANLFAFWFPDLIAGSFANVPRVNFSSVDDPNSYTQWLTPICSFNTGQIQRATVDQMFGTPASNLLGPEGKPAFDWMNGEKLAAWRAADGSAPIIAFNGRDDGTIGWHEKPPFYAAMEQHRQGVQFFWDNRSHLSNNQDVYWSPMMSAAYLYRLRLDRTYPALSNCSADDDPGDGTTASGDSVGVINAFVEWDTLSTDTPTVWSMHLRLRNLSSKLGLVPAPESLTVDVTPRRLQQFVVSPGGVFEFEVRRSSDNALVRTGQVVADSLGLITIPTVPVYKTGGSQLTINPAPTLGVPISTVVQPRLTLARNPVRDVLDLDIQWSASGPAEVALFDLNGRRRSVLLNQSVKAERMSVQTRTADLSPGVYFIRAQQGGQETVRRVVIVR